MKALLAVEKSQPSKLKRNVLNILNFSAENTDNRETVKSGGGGGVGGIWYYRGMCSHKRYSFLGVLVKNREKILVIFSSNMKKLGMFL